MRLQFAALALAGMLTACAGFQPQPADPAMVAKIVRACTASGLFVAVNGAVTSAVPVPGLALAGQGVDALVMRVCADPARFAADAATVEAVVRQLARTRMGE